MAIGANWAEIWKPVWKAVWTQEPAIPPEPEPLPPVSTGAPGGGRRYVAYINGKRHLGTLPQIQATIDAFAKTQAKKAVEQRVEPKKPRIVVEFVREAKALPKSVPYEQPQALNIQAVIRDNYLAAYVRAKIELENEEDDILSLIL